MRERDDDTGQKTWRPDARDGDAIPGVFADSNGQQPVRAYAQPPIFDGIAAATAELVRQREITSDRPMREARRQPAPPRSRPPYRTRSLRRVTA